MARRLSNYLKSYRMRAGLSQDELAFLLGLSGGPKVSRYERGRRIPTLKTLLAYERVLGVPTRELFTGLNEQVDRETRSRARMLATRLAAQSPRSPRTRALAQLGALSGDGSGESDLATCNAA